MEILYVDSISYDKTMIIISHRLSSLSGCDEIIKVDQGKIIIS